MHKNTENITVLDKIIKWMALAGLLFFLIYVVWGILVSPDFGFFNESAHIYGGEWVRCLLQYQLDKFYLE